MVSYVFVVPHDGKIRNIIMISVTVFVMNVISFWYFSVVVFPNRSVQPFPFMLKILTAFIERLTVKLLNCITDYQNFHTSLPPCLPTDFRCKSKHRSEA